MFILEYKRVMADDYMVVDGMHEAIIDRNLWEATRLRRKDTGVKWNKTHSMDHEHILTGMEDTIAEIEEKISGAYGEKNTADELYKALLSFDRMYFKMTDLEKKRFMRDFIDEIELYPERQEDGRILKQLSFFE